MRQEEMAHGQMARDFGAKELPPLIQSTMRRVSGLMTKIAYSI
jgi:demethoxyubiquinone hydroxylase (CLK1/Coq7/Cat5 family)